MSMEATINAESGRVPIRSNGLFGMVSFSPVDLAEANVMLEMWGHKMGGLHRGNQGAWCHALTHEGEAVGIVTASTLIMPRVGGAGWLTRENCVELSRLAASREGLCRVVLRLWREFVFPSLGYKWAVSYSDNAIHRGELYRCDGWQKVAQARSGTDTRSGRPGRKKSVWVWPRKDIPLPNVKDQLSRESAHEHEDKP